MSQWTHVAGMIRVDGLEFIDGDIKTEIEDIIGRTTEYEDLLADGDNWETVMASCTIPMGSEMSLEYEVHRIGRENWLDWGYIAIHGDLRDYTDVQEIYDWVKQLCEKIDSILKLSIRMCSVQVEVEGGAQYIIYDVYDENGDTKIWMHELP